MTARRALLLAACAALPAAAAWAADPVPPVIAGIRARLAHAPVLRGTFEQRKRIAGFRNPLVSRGDFLVWRDHGVFWRTVSPYPSTLVLTRDRLQARQADGSVGTRLDAREEPGLRAFNETLFALMSTDLTALARQFAVEGALNGGEGWSLALVPRDAGMARFVSRIVLDGDRFVRSVVLTEAQGDGTVIRFGQQVSADAPTAEEAAWFD